jgi:hypothetical protein
MALAFQHPFTCIIAGIQYETVFFNCIYNFTLIFFLGPSSSGKSTLIAKLIREIDSIIEPQVEEVIYCLPRGQPFENKLPKFVKIHEGVPDVETFSDCKKRLLILDDLMSSADQNVVDLFTKGSHHYNVSVIFIMQNLFSQKRGQRDISLNAHYILLFKNPRDKNQCCFLSRQVYPENPKFIQEAFLDATSKGFGYLLFDLTQKMNDNYRFRTNIFSTDFPQNVIYVSKDANINETI